MDVMKDVNFILSQEVSLMIRVISIKVWMLGLPCQLQSQCKWPQLVIHYSTYWGIIEVTAQASGMLKTSVSHSHATTAWQAKSQHSQAVFPSIFQIYSHLQLYLWGHVVTVKIDTWPQEHALSWWGHLQVHQHNLPASFFAQVADHQYQK